MHLPETEFLACKHLEGSAKDLQFIRDFEVPFPETGKGLEYKMNKPGECAHIL